MNSTSDPEAAAAARIPARERLLAAAGELFYEEGVHSVGIDRVIERAGVAKASLYGNFKGKDDLVRAYLEMRRDARQVRIEQRLATLETPHQKVLGVFDVLGDVFAQPNYRGCAFVRASAETLPDSGVRDVCERARAWTRALFAGLASAAGASQPELLAQQLVLLYDGASVSAQMDGDPGAAQAARAIAAQLLDQACRKARRK